MVKAMDYGIVESSNSSRSLSEKYAPPYHPIYGLNSTTIVLNNEKKHRFGIE